VGFVGKKVKYWLVVFSALIVLSILLGVYAAFNGNPISHYLMEKATMNYLLEQGYHEEEIAEIEATYNMKRNTERIKGTVAYVKFKDEPNEQYEYIQWRKSGKIQQSCYYFDEASNAFETKYTEERKHMEKSCTNKF
jgi:glycyl-tRNA synthetase alpha subunit